MLQQQCAKPLPGGANKPTLRQPTVAAALCPPPLHYPVQLAAGHSRHAREEQRQILRAPPSTVPVCSVTPQAETLTTAVTTISISRAYVSEYVQVTTTYFHRRPPLAMPRCKRLMLRFPRRNGPGVWTKARLVPSRRLTQEAWLAALMLGLS